jgi:serine/threonine protein kinase
MYGHVSLLNLPISCSSFHLSHHHSRSINDHDFEYTRVDANIAERLTASPRIYDIYGHCGIGILSEWFPHGDMEVSSIDYDGYPEVADIQKDLQSGGGTLKVYNNLSPRDKLRAALHMAEAVADLHGYAHGVIVHQDIQLSQFLLNRDSTRVKLNDFNRAEFMLWDEEGQEYCKYSPGAAHGNVSSVLWSGDDACDLTRRDAWSFLFVYLLLSLILL